MSKEVYEWVRGDGGSGYCELWRTDDGGGVFRGTVFSITKEYDMVKERIRWIPQIREMCELPPVKTLKAAKEILELIKKNIVW